MEFNVYKITNTKNGFIYIGATSNPIKKRFIQHCNCKNYDYLLYKDMLNYGVQFFKIELIENCIDKNHMMEREMYWIDFYLNQSPDLIYNLKKPYKQFIPTPEHLAMCGEIKAQLKRNQRWLADQIGMREPVLSNKIKNIEDFTQDELDAINKVLGTNFKL